MAKKKSFLSGLGSEDVIPAVEQTSSAKKLTHTTHPMTGEVTEIPAPEAAPIADDKQEVDEEPVYADNAPITEQPDTYISDALDIQKFANAPLTESAITAIAEEIQDAMIYDSTQGDGLFFDGIAMQIENNEIIKQYNAVALALAPLFTSPIYFEDNKFRASSAAVESLTQGHISSLPKEVLLKNGFNASLATILGASDTSYKDEKYQKPVSLEEYARNVAIMARGLEWEKPEQAQMFEAVMHDVIDAATDALGISHAPHDMPYAGNAPTAQR